MFNFFLKSNSMEIENYLKPIRSGKKIVFTNGCFDLLHIGHIRYLNEARLQGDLLVVGVNSDKSVKRLKGEDRPIQREEDRLEILANLKSVDMVCLFEEDSPLNLIHKVMPDVLVKGGDWSVDQIVGADFVLERGGEVKSLKFIDGRSSSKIIDKICKEKK